MKNKNGWMKIVEAFVAILLVSGLLLVVIGDRQIKKVDLSPMIFDIEISILREIQLNDSLRNQILSIGENSLPIVWAGFPIEKVPSNLECESKICKVGVLCSSEKYPDQEVYSQSVIISADLQSFSPRVLKLFCSNV